MRIGFWKSGLAVALVLAASTIAIESANATTFTIDSAGIGAPGYVTTVVHFAGLKGGSENAEVGRIALGGTNSLGQAVSFDTYCVDLVDPLGPGTFSSALMTTLPYTAAQLTALTTFITHADALVKTNVDAAAVQMGAWEILNEAPTNHYDLTSGAFSVSGNANVGKAAAEANSWLTDLTTHAWQPEAGLHLALLTPGAGNQAQVSVVRSTAIVTGAVPEPGTWMMTLSGFALAGAMLRSNRRRSDVDGELA
jgi:hypothetical protein